jgi:hypothetical protein
MTEGPNFVGLDVSTGKIGEADILEVGAGGANLRQQMENGIFRDTGHAFGAANGIAFDESGDDLDAFGCAELVQIGYYT